MECFYDVRINDDGFKEKLKEELEPMLIAKDLIKLECLSKKDVKELSKRPTREERVELLLEKLKADVAYGFPSLLWALKWSGGYVTLVDDLEKRRALMTIDVEKSFNDRFGKNNAGISFFQLNFILLFVNAISTKDATKLGEVLSLGGNDRQTIADMLTDDIKRRKKDAKRQSLIERIQEIGLPTCKSAFDMRKKVLSYPTIRLKYACSKIRLSSLHQTSLKMYLFFREEYGIHFEKIEQEESLLHLKVPTTMALKLLVKDSKEGRLDTKLAERCSLVNQRSCGCCNLHTQIDEKELSEVQRKLTTPDEYLNLPSTGSWDSMASTFVKAMNDHRKEKLCGHFEIKVTDRVNFFNVLLSEWVVTDTDVSKLFESLHFFGFTDLLKILKNYISELNPGEQVILTSENANDWEKIIPDITEELDPISVAPYLLADGIINKDERDSLVKTNSRRKRAMELIKILKREPKLRLLPFITALQMCGYHNFLIQYFKHGKHHGPVQIVSPADKNLKFEEENFKQILEKNKDDLRGIKKICVVAIAGEHRTGKSFLLSFILRYLMNKGRRDWIQMDTKLSEGFAWRGGSAGHTMGIWAWDKLFIREIEGERIAVLLLDTQGAYDLQASSQQTSKIFALSALISSVLVYNIPKKIALDNLQSLQFFTEYGRMALKNSSTGKPFQSLIFLVRDWPYRTEHGYGKKGGKDYLTKQFDMTVDDPSKNDTLKGITSSFDSRSCFLMPPPGPRVQESQDHKEFEGCPRDIERSEFVECLKELLPWMNTFFHPTKIKKINDSCIDLFELGQYVKKYADIFSGEEFPDALSAANATMQVYNTRSVELALEVYNAEMNKVVKDEFIEEEQLKIHHDTSKATAVEEYNNGRKMGGQHVLNKYNSKLLEKIESSYDIFKERNRYKRSFLQHLSGILPVVAAVGVVCVGAIATWGAAVAAVATLIAFPVEAFFGVSAIGAVAAATTYVYRSFRAAMDAALTPIQREHLPLDQGVQAMCTPILKVIAGYICFALLVYCLIPSLFHAHSYTIGHMFLVAMHCAALTYIIYYKFFEQRDDNIENPG